MTPGAWTSPTGEVFDAGRDHAEWAEAYADEHGIAIPEDEHDLVDRDDRALTRFFELGWVRTVANDIQVGAADPALVARIARDMAKKLQLGQTVNVARGDEANPAYLRLRVDERGRIDMQALAAFLAGSSGRTAGLLEAPPRLIEQVLECIAKTLEAWRTGASRTWTSEVIEPDFTGWKYEDKVKPDRAHGRMTVNVERRQGRDSLLGTWDRKNRVLSVHARPLRTKREIAAYLAGPGRRTVEHELEHFVQDILGDSVGGPWDPAGVGGLPVPGRMFDEVLEASEPYDTKLREFYPILGDQVREYQDLKLANPRAWIRSSPFFKALHENDPVLWRKAVKLFVAAVGTPKRAFAGPQRVWKEGEEAIHSAGERVRIVKRLDRKGGVSGYIVRFLGGRRDGEQVCATPSALKPADEAWDTAKVALHVIAADVTAEAWHGTFGGFEVFEHDRSGLGTHFGTERSADERLRRPSDEPYIDEDEDEDGNVIEREIYETEYSEERPYDSEMRKYELAITNPLRCHDIGKWNDVTVVVGELAYRNIIADGEAVIQSLAVRRSEEVWPILRAAIEAKGYDSVVYQNKFEDIGSDSWIVWDNAKLKRLALRITAADLETIDADNYDLLRGLSRPDCMYRGMSGAEYEATVAAGKPLVSDKRWCLPTEGTCYSATVDDAASYANFGRTDPRKTGTPNYIVEVARPAQDATDRDGYLKTDAMTPADVRRVWRVTGTPEGGLAGALVKTAASAGSLTLYHGTSRANAESIQQEGLKSPIGYGRPQWYMLADKFEDAAAHSAGYGGPPVVLTFQVPAGTRRDWPGFPYVWPPGPQGWYALRELVPAAFVTALTPVEPAEREAKIQVTAADVTAGLPDVPPVMWANMREKLIDFVDQLGRAKSRIVFERWEKLRDHAQRLLRIVEGRDNTAAAVALQPFKMGADEDALPRNFDFNDLEDDATLARYTAATSPRTFTFEQRPDGRWAMLDERGQAYEVTDTAEEMSQLARSYLANTVDMTGAAVSGLQRYVQRIQSLSRGSQLSATSYVRYDLPVDLTGWSYTPQRHYKDIGLFLSAEEHPNAAGHWLSEGMVNIYDLWDAAEATDDPERLAVNSTELRWKLGVLRHELTHMVQSMLRDQTEPGGKPGGLPFSTYDDAEHAKVGHAMRDIEFYPNMVGEVMAYVDARATDPKKWIAERPRFQKMKAEPARWRKAVEAFTRIVAKADMFRDTGKPGSNAYGLHVDPYSVSSRVPANTLKAASEARAAMEGYAAAFEKARQGATAAVAPYVSVNAEVFESSGNDREPVQRRHHVLLLDRARGFGDVSKWEVFCGGAERTQGPFETREEATKVFLWKLEQLESNVKYAIQELDAWIVELRERLSWSRGGALRVTAAELTMRAAVADGIVYHGSRAPGLQALKAIDPGYAGNIGAGVYVAYDPEVARFYGPYVYQLRLKISEDQIFWLTPDNIDFGEDANSILVGENVQPFSFMLNDQRYSVTAGTGWMDDDEAIEQRALTGVLEALRATKKPEWLAVAAYLERRDSIEDDIADELSYIMELEDPPAAPLSLFPAEPMPEVRPPAAMLAWYAHVLRAARAQARAQVGTAISLDQLGNEVRAAGYRAVYLEGVRGAFPDTELLVFDADDLEMVGPVDPDTIPPGDDGVDRDAALRVTADDLAPPASPLANLTRIYELEYKWSKLEYARRQGPLGDRAERTLAEWGRELDQRVTTELAHYTQTYDDWLVGHWRDSPRFIDDETGIENHKLLGEVVTELRRETGLAETIRVLGPGPNDPGMAVLREGQESGAENAKTFEELAARPGLEGSAAVIKRFEQVVHARTRTKAFERVREGYLRVKGAAGLPLKQRIVLLHQLLTIAHNGGAMAEHLYLDRTSADIDDVLGGLTALNEMQPPAAWDRELAQLIGLPRGGKLVVTAADVTAAGLEAPPAMVKAVRDVFERATRVIAQEQVYKQLLVRQDIPRQLEQAPYDLAAMPTDVAELTPGEIVAYDLPQLGAAQKQEVVIWRRPAYASNPNKYQVYLRTDGENEKFRIEDALDLEPAIAKAQDTLNHAVANATKVQKVFDEKNLSAADEEFVREPADRSGLMRAPYGEAYWEAHVRVDFTGSRYADQVDTEKLPATIEVQIHPGPSPEDRGGDWAQATPGEFRLRLWVGGVPQSEAGVQQATQNIEGLIHHELAHGVQGLLQMGNELPTLGGRPPGRGKYDHRKDHARPHGLRDVEFYPNIISAAYAFKRWRAREGTGDVREDVRLFMATNHYFKTMKQMPVARQQKMTTEFLRAVTQMDAPTETKQPGSVLERQTRRRQVRDEDERNHHAVPDAFVGRLLTLGYNCNRRELAAAGFPDWRAWVRGQLSEQLSMVVENESQLYPLLNKLPKNVNGDGPDLARLIDRFRDGAGLNYAPLPQADDDQETFEEYQSRTQRHRGPKPESVTVTAAALEPRAYPLAGASVSGLTVGPKVDNMGSISAGLTGYTVQHGIREVPMSDFAPVGRHYNARDCDQIDRLAEAIKTSGRIDPLIVVVDRQGPYLLEGLHRLHALDQLGVASFPALVVTDDEDFEEPSTPHIAAGGVRLYRAADPGEDAFQGISSWSPDRTVAEAYLDNPGFGGPQLYRSAQPVDSAAAFDCRGRENQLHLAQLVRPDADPDEVVDEWGRQTGWLETGLSELTAVRAALERHGFHWAIVQDSFPAGAETWTHISPEWVDAVPLKKRTAWLKPGKVAGANAVGVVRVPRALARVWPKDFEEKHQPPHLTLCFMKGPFDEQQHAALLEAVTRVAGETAPIPVELERGVDWFTSDDPKETARGTPEIAHKTVHPKTAERMTKLHWDLVGALEAAGFKPATRATFKTHGTLAYCPERKYTGPVPEGGWNADTIEVWGWEETAVVKLAGERAKIKITSADVAQGEA